MAASYISLIVIISFLLQSNAINTNTIPNFVAKYCIQSINDANLFLEGDSRATLMTDLSLNAANNTFYATKSTSGNNTSYGLFYCTANIDVETCKACVKFAANYCMFNMAGFIFHEECTLRFSTHPVLGVVDYDSIVGWSYSLSSASYTQFNDTLYSELGQAIPLAVNASTRFATGASSLKGTGKKLYTLAQCTPDILTADCETCLQAALKKMPLCDNATCGNPQRMSIMTLLPSCQLRYEVRLSSSQSGTITSSPSSASLLGTNVWNMMLQLVVVIVVVLYNLY